MIQYVLKFKLWIHFVKIPQFVCIDKFVCKVIKTVFY